MMTPQQVHGLQQEIGATAGEARSTSSLREKLVQRGLSLTAYHTSQSSSFIVLLSLSQQEMEWLRQSPTTLPRVLPGKKQIKPVHVSLPQQVHVLQQEIERLLEDRFMRTPPTRF